MSSECRDPRFADMLYAGELDLLSDEDRRALEIHLLECDACFQAASELESAVLHINRDPAVRDAIQKSAAATEMSSRSLWRRYVPAVAAVLVLFALILQPWRPGLDPRDPLEAGIPRLAILDFENLKEQNDPDRLGEIISNLLITDLSESHYLQVVSSQRMYDTRHRLGFGSRSALQPEQADRIAREVDARWLLTGSILQEKPHLVVSSQILDVQSGDVIASQKVSGSADGDVFALVDRLTVEVKTDMALPREAMIEPDLSIAGITTNSRQAYMHFIEGRRQEARVERAAAVRSYRAALENDSTMAMAYYRLSRLAEPHLLARALKYSDRVGTRDRTHILARSTLYLGDTATAMGYYREAIERFPDEKEFLLSLHVYMTSLGNRDEAFDYLTRLLEIDPDHKVAVNMMAYTWASRRNLDSALVYLDRYQALAPDEANPYDSRGQIYSMFGLLDSAKFYYKEALKRDRSFYHSLIGLAHAGLCDHDFETVKEAIDRLDNFRDDVLDGEIPQLRALLYLRKGQAQRAVATLETSLRNSALGRRPSEIASERFLLAHLLSDAGRSDEALAQLARCDYTMIDSMNTFYALKLRHIEGAVLVNNGLHREASQVAVEIIQDVPDSIQALYGFYYVTGAEKLRQKEFAIAAENLSQAVASYPSFMGDLMLARAELEAESREGLADELLFLANSCTRHRTLWGSWQIRVHYYAGLALESDRRFEEAEQQYSLYLRSWGESNLNKDEVADARQRLSRLRSSP